MKRLTLTLLTVALFFMSGCVKDFDPVDYVNPYAGNVSHLLVPTFPTVQLPNSMLRVYPERSDYTSEYLNGLPVIVTNHRERSAFKLSVITRSLSGAEGSGAEGPMISAKRSIRSAPTQS